MSALMVAGFYLSLILSGSYTSIVNQGLIVEMIILSLLKEKWEKLQGDDFEQTVRNELTNGLQWKAIQTANEQVVTITRCSLEKLS